MNFLAPQWLWTLFAVIPLVAAYLLRVRPRRRPVTAFFLWQRILGQRKAASLFQRLRDALSLLLTLAALAAAVLPWLNAAVGVAGIQHPLGAPA